MDRIRKRQLRTARRVTVRFSEAELGALDLLLLSHRTSAAGIIRHLVWQAADQLSRNQVTGGPGERSKD